MTPIITAIKIMAVCSTAASLPVLSCGFCFMVMMSVRQPTHKGLLCRTRGGYLLPVDAKTIFT